MPAENSTRETQSPKRAVGRGWIDNDNMIMITHALQKKYRQRVKTETKNAKDRNVSPRCASGCVVECRICSWEVAGSNLGRGYFAPRSTQPSIPSRSVNEYRLGLGRQRQVWLIPIADETQGVQVKL